MFGPSVVLVSRPAGRLSVGNETRLCSFIRGAGDTAIVIDRSETLLGLVPNVFRVSSDNVRFCPVGCSRCGRAISTRCTTGITDLRGRRGRLGGTRGLTRGAVRQRRGRTSEKRGRDTKRNVTHVTVKGEHSDSRTTASRLGGMRRSGLREVDRRMRRVQTSVDSSGSIGVGVDGSSVRKYGQLVRTSDLACECRKQSIL